MANMAKTMFKLKFVQFNFAFQFLGFLVFLADPLRRMSLKTIA